MKRFPWTRGPESARGSVFVSATRFTYDSLGVMPFVLWHGLQLTRRWHTIEGAVGVCTAVRLSSRTTVSMSVWRDEAHLARWFRSEPHASLVRGYAKRLVSSSATGWWTDAFEREAAWSEALARLATCPPDAAIERAIRS